MSTTNGRVKKSKGQEFVPAPDGLDDELASFINSLVDQNAELAGKLENIDSLMELAEKTVIESGKEAEGIKLEAEKEANARAASIVARAEERAQAAAQKIIARAKKKAEAEARRIIAEAGKRAEESVQEKLSLAEQQARDIMKAAEEKPPEPPVPHAAVSVAPAASVEEPVEQPSPGEKKRTTRKSLLPIKTLWNWRFRLP